MQRRTALMIVVVMLGLASVACNLYPGVPATPTLIPTYETPTPTPLISTRAVLLPSQTATPSATATLTSTLTQTLTIAPSVIASSTITEQPSLTATASATLTASATPVIVTQTFTALPPTLTTTPRPTVTPSLTLTLTPTGSPTATMTMTMTTTSLPPQLAVTVTNPPTISTAPTTAPLPVTFTPLPIVLVASQTPRPTVSQVPATLERPVIVITSTPQPSVTAGTPIPVPGVTSTPLSVASVPTVGVEQLADGQTSVVGNVLQPPLRDAQGQVVLDFDISRDQRQVIINAAGQALIDGVRYVGDDKHTRQRFIAARWSPDGRYLAYIVRRDNAESGTLSWSDTIDDGVWVLDSTPGSKPRLIYRNYYFRASNDFPYRMALAVDWANDSYALLITVDTVAGQATVLAGIGGENQFFQDAPGTWLLDSNGWMITKAENGNVTLGVRERNGGFTPLLNSLQAGLWIQNPAQFADGRYAFLGKPALSGQLEGGASNLQLYIFTPGQPPVPVSAPLAGEVVSAEWSPNRQAVLVHLRTADGVSVQVLTLNGGLVDYTPYTNGSSGTHWRR